MAIYDDQGDLIGYRFKQEAEQPPRHRLYDVGSRLLFRTHTDGSITSALRIAVSFA